MSESIKVPEFPESINDGVLAVIHKKVGEFVNIGDVIADIETDKVLFEVPSTVVGIIEEVLEEGEIVISGQILAKVLNDDSSQSSNVVAMKSEDSTNKKMQVSETTIISPSAEKMAVENKVDINKVYGSGKDGRIIKADVISYIEHVTEARAPSNNPDAIVDENNNPENTDTDQRFQKRVPMSRLRKKIAQRLLDSQKNAAILTTFNEVNMQAIIELRSRYADRFEESHGVRLGFMSFFIKATVEALKQFPEINASTDGNDIIYHGFVDMGIAVGSPRGLVVPILRDVDTLSVASIEKSILALSERANSGKLTMEELTGGTFSITNGGVFGSMLSTPILNPPQSGILGMHKIEKRPVVINDEIVIRAMMYLAFSYDHRIIDGKEAVKFLVTIKEELEDPARILLEI